MKKAKLNIIFLALGLIGLILVSSCGIDPTNSPTAVTGNQGATTTPATVSKSKVIKIALASSLTSAGAIFATGITNTAQIAIDECNARQCVPGYTIVGVPFDDMVQPTQAASIAHTIAADPDIYGVIGHLFSGLTLAALPAYKAANLAVISPSASKTSLTNGDYPNFFRTVTRDDVQAPAGADYLADTLKIKNVFIIQEDNAYGNGVINDFKVEAIKKGLNIVETAKVPDKATDYTTVLPKITADKPDIIVFGGYGSEASSYINSAASSGINIPLFGFDGIGTSSTVISSTAVTSNVSYTSINPAITTVWSADMINKYKTRFNADPDSSLPPTYDATNILLQAIAKVITAQGKPDRAAIVAAVAATKDFPATTGMMSFDAHGDTTNKTIYIYQLKDGKYPGVQIGKTGSGN